MISAAMRERFFGAVIALSAVMLLTLTAAPSAAVAQQVPGACAVPVSQAPGGETIRLSTLEVTLPEGYTYQWGIFAESGAAHMRICVKEYGAEVSINMLTAVESARVVPVAAAGPILDQIAASARVLALPGQPTFTPTPTPTPIPTATPVPPTAVPVVPSAGGSGGGGGAGGSSITPPNTGDAGLTR